MTHTSTRIFKLENRCTGNRTVGSNPTLSVPNWLCIRGCRVISKFGYISGYSGTAGELRNSIATLTNMPMPTPSTNPNVFHHQSGIIITSGI
jgi:hypothetical protein